MSERVRAYFKELELRSSEDLDSSAVTIASDEKQNVARLIAHIAEIGKRKYYLKLGYTSLFEYCVSRLNLGEGTVHRRTQVAKICRAVPQILEALHAGRLHLTGACLIAPHLTAENVESLIRAAEGKTKRAIEEILITLAPKKEFNPSIRKQPSSKPAMRDQEVNEEPSNVPAPEEPKLEDKTPSPAGGQRSHDLLQPATEERYNFRFSAGNEFTDRFKRAAEVLNINSPHCHIEEVFDAALEALLEKKDPKRKQERRRKREAQKTPPGEEKPTENESASPTVSRYIPSEVRERVLDKAGQQCDYHGPDGVRCSSRTGLEVDHTLPFAVYQRNDEDTLRALCPAHNRF